MEHLGLEPVPTWEVSSASGHFLCYVMTLAPLLKLAYIETRYNDSLQIKMVVVRLGVNLVAVVFKYKYIKH